MLAPFGVRNYRFQWPADLLTSLAFEMELLALGWYVLVETGSVVWLTTFGALQFHGTLVSPMIGVIGDRIGHRNLLCVMRAWYTALSSTLMLLVFAGWISPAVVIAAAAITGLVRPSDLAVRGATVASNVPTGVLVGAMAISRSTSDVARVCGALMGAGLLAKLGMGPAYIVIVACYAVGMVLTLCVDRSIRTPVAGMAGQPAASPWRDLREGLDYVRRSPQLLAAMWLAFLMNMTTLPMSGGLLPFVAKGVYHTDQTGLGMLSASFAAGALVGSVALSAVSDRLMAARMMIGASLVWCVLLIVFARNQSYGLGLAMMIAIGFVQSLSMVTMAILLLKTSEERLRGRVMGVRMLAIVSQVAGLPLAGVLIGSIGFAATGMIYAGGALLCTVLILIKWQIHLWPEQAVANARSV